MDIAVEHPVPFHLMDGFLRKGIFLQQKVFCPLAELQPDMKRLAAVNTEDVRGLQMMSVLLGPGLEEDFDFSHAGNLEDLVAPVLQVVAPYIDVVGSEGERFDQTVADLSRIRRLVAVQDNLAFALDCIGEGLHIGGVGPVAYE